MGSAYKCDKCGVLFLNKCQSISVEYKNTRLGETFISVNVAQGYDLCGQCVGVALDKAVDKHKEN